MSSVIERTIKGGAGFFTANLVSKGFGFLFIVVASRLLGPAEFGVLSLGLSVTGVARNFAAFGLPNTIQRFLSGSGEDRSAQIYSAVLVIGGITAALSSAGLYILAPWLSVKIFNELALVTPLQILSVGVIVGVAATILRAILQAQEQVRRIILLDSVRSLAKVLFAMVIFFWVRTATGAAWAVVGSFALAAIIGGRYVSRLDIQPSFRIMDAEFGTVLGYAAPLVVVGFSYFLAQQADRLMLGWLADAEVVGLYTVTSTLAMVMSTLNSALASIFLPIASQGYRNKTMKKVRKSYLFISKWGSTANGIALFAFAGGGPWILQIFGVSYATDTTYYVLLILAGFYFINVWVGPTGALIIMSDGHRMELINTLLFIFINIGLNYVLIVEYGIAGAALATFIAGAIWNIIQVCEITYLYGITPMRHQNLVLLVVVGSGVPALMFAEAGVQRMIFALGCIGALAAYVLWTTSEEEQRFFLKLLSRTPFV